MLAVCLMYLLLLRVPLLKKNIIMSLKKVIPNNEMRVNYCNFKFMKTPKISIFVSISKIIYNNLFYLFEHYAYTYCICGNFTFEKWNHYYVLCVLVCWY